MKVQHKSNPEHVFDVIEESKGYYVVTSRDGFTNIALHKSVYEPVPEVRWVNVTAKCVEYSHGVGIPTVPGMIVQYMLTGYRLVKVQLYRKMPPIPGWNTTPGSYPSGPDAYVQCDAFVIEKQEAE